MKKIAKVSFAVCLLISSIINMATSKIVHLGIGFYTSFALMMLITSVIEGKSFEKMEKTQKKFIALGALLIVFLFGCLLLLMNVQFGSGLMSGSILSGILITLNERIELFLTNSLKTASQDIYQGLENLSEIPEEVILTEKALGAKSEKTQSNVIEHRPSLSAARQTAQAS